MLCIFIYLSLALIIMLIIQGIQCAVCPYVPYQACVYTVIVFTAFDYRVVSYRTVPCILFKLVPGKLEAVTYCTIPFSQCPHALSALCTKQRTMAAWALLSLIAYFPTVGRSCDCVAGVQTTILTNGGCCDTRGITHPHD